VTRFSFGLGVGFAAGYYLGSRAGRQRYEQINRAVARARRSRPVQKLRAGIDLGRERWRTRGDGAVQLVLVDETGDASPPIGAQGSSR
jgi:hypothetical protein